MAYVTEDEIARYKEAFTLFDQDQDMALTIPELKRVMRALGLFLSENDFQKLSEDFLETYGKRTVDYSVFLAIMSKYRSSKSLQHEELVQAFRVFDPTCSGVVDIKELKHCLTNVGEPITEEEFEELIQAGGADSSRPLEYMRFIEMISKEFDDTDDSMENDMFRQNYTARNRSESSFNSDYRDSNDYYNSDDNSLESAKVKLDSSEDY